MKITTNKIFFMGFDAEWKRQETPFGKQTKKVFDRIEVKADADFIFYLYGESCLVGDPRFWISHDGETIFEMKVTLCDYDMAWEVAKGSFESFFKQVVKLGRDEQRKSKEAK